MKKLMYLLVIGVMFAFTACGDGDAYTTCADDCAKECCVVGDTWIEKDEKKEESPIIVAEGWDRPNAKKEFMKGCFSGFGDSFTSERKQTIEKYCSCCLEKMMDKYSSYEEMNKAASTWTIEEFGNAAGDCTDILR